MANNKESMNCSEDGTKDTLFSYTNQAKIIQNDARVLTINDVSEESVNNYNSRENKYSFGNTEQIKQEDDLSNMKTREGKLYF